MRAVIIAANGTAPLDPLTRRRPGALLRIGDKPIIFHIVEFLAAQGWRRFDILLHDLPEMIEAKLQDGKRWGVDITYQLIKNPERPYHLLNSIAGGWVSDDKVLVGQATVLPLIRFLECPQPDVKPSLIMESGGKWLGWGLFLASHLANLPPDATQEILPNRVPHNPITLPERFLISARNFRDLLGTNRQFLEGSLPGVTPPASARKVEEGIWIAAGAKVHSSAIIKKPAYIGRNSQIQDHCQIGPNALIESNCIVDAHSTIENALVCQHSYVGDDLEICNSIVDRQWLINLTRNTQVRISDDFILCNLQASPLSQRAFFLLERLLGTVLLILALPLIALIRPFCHVHRREVLSLPSSQEKHLWRTFNWWHFNPQYFRLPLWLQYLPNLVHLALGRIHFVGLTPRSTSEVEKLPYDWRGLYLAAKLGMVTLQDLDPCHHFSQDEVYASEVYYTAHMSPGFDIKTLFKFLVVKNLERLFKRD